MKNSWEKSERVNEWAEFALNVAGMILFMGGWLAMLLLWFLGVI